MPLAQLPNVAEHPDALMHLVVYLVLAGQVLMIATAIINLLRGGKKGDAEKFAMAVKLAMDDHRLDANAHNGKYAKPGDVDTKIEACRQRRIEIEAAIRARRSTHEEPHRG